MLNFKKAFKELQEKAVQESFKETSQQIVQTELRADTDQEALVEKVEESQQAQSERKFRVMVELLKVEVGELEKSNREALSD